MPSCINKRTLPWDWKGGASAPPFRPAWGMPLVLSCRPRSLTYENLFPYTCHVSARTLPVAVGWLVFPLAFALGQQAPPASAIPAATPSQADCTGFLTANKVPAKIIVTDGADNDFESYLRQYAVGDLIYLWSRGNPQFSVGEQFSIVRRAKELFRTTRYAGEHSAIRGLGRPYEDAGRVQVTRITPEGAIAQVRFTCGPIYPGDLAIPYQPRLIPAYVPTKLDRFASPSGKIEGAIVAARNNYASLGNGDIVYLNFGERKGAKAGQLYRVYYSLPRPSGWAVFCRPLIPRETLAEVVVLSTQEKSAVGIIVNSTRDINVGYGLELE